MTAPKTVLPDDVRRLPLAEKLKRLEMMDPEALKRADLERNPAGDGVE